MIPRKRPRTGEADTSANNMANRQIETSNSTLQTFLNTGQKSWMTTGGVPSNAKLQARPLKPPNKNLATQRGRPVSRLNTSIPTTNISGNNPPVISSATITTPSETGRIDESTVQRQQPTQTPNTTVAGNLVDIVADATCSPLQRTTVLPSPAPSEDAARNSDDAAENSARNRESGPPRPAAPTGPITQNPAQNSPESPAVGEAASTEGPRQNVPQADTAVSSRSASATPNVENDRLRELAARYGGIDELERHLEFSRRASISQRSNPHSPLQGQMPTQSPITREANAQRLRNSSSGFTTPVQQGCIVPSQPLRNASHPLGPTWPAAVRPASGHAQVAQPQSSPLLPIASNAGEFEGFLRKLFARSAAMSTSQTLDPEKKSLEDGRLHLLAEACQIRDVSYLCIHQFFCLRSLPEFGFEAYIAEEEKEGFNALSGLLVSNQELDPDSVRWFANFPLPSPHMPTAFAEALNGVRASLRGLAGNWLRFREQHQKAGSTPYVDNIIRYLSINSTVLQRVIFKCIYRGLWVGPEDDCFDRSVKLFELSQEQFNTWLRNYNGSIPANVIGSWQKDLAGKYRVFATQHTRHIHSRVNSLEMGMPNDTRFVPAGQEQPTPLCIVSEAQPAQILTSSGAVNQSPEIIQSNIRSLPQVASNDSPNFQTPSYPMSTREGGFTNTRRQSSLITSQSTHRAAQSSSANQDARGQSTHQPPSHQRTNSRTASQSRSSTGSIHQRRRSSNNLTMDIPAVPAIALSHWHRMPNQGSQAVSQGLPQTTNTNNDVFHTEGIIRHLHSQNTQPMPPGQTPNMSSSLFPRGPPRQMQPQQNHPLGIPIYQCDLHDAVYLPSDEAFFSGNQKVYSYLKGFLVEPVQIKPVTQNVRAKFTLDEDVYSKLPSTQRDKFGSPPLRKLSSSSLLIRVRCIRPKKTLPSESEWAVADTEWPPSLVLMVNEQCLRVRRKADWGKDLAVDLTGNVKQGENAVQASFLKNPQTPEKNYCYALAVEILSICFEGSLKGQVQQPHSSEIKERILKQLNTSDDEVEVVSDDIVVKVTDPFSSQLVTNPVRGKNCVHHECFDLDIFLQTLKPNPLFPEQFRCPCCKEDARPMNLLVDPWFVEILGKIKDAGEEEAKAIVVDKEAKWRIKEEEKDGEGGDVTGMKVKLRQQGLGGVSSDAMVIDLDDDD